MSRAQSTRPADGGGRARARRLGYKQELHRGWSSFTNFAISFTIISVLAGPVTNFSFAWNAGGRSRSRSAGPSCALSCCWSLLDGRAHIGVPDRGWPVLVVGQARQPGLELDHRVVQHRRPRWNRRRRRLRRGVLPSGNAGLYNLNVLGINFATTNPTTILHETFLLFLIILVGYTVVNIFADRLLAIFNNVSVGWHVLGVLVIIALVAFVPSHHQSPSFVFGQRFNNTGFHGGRPAAWASGCTSSRSASSSRCTRRPATTPPRTLRRRRAARRRRRRRACGARCSTPRSPAGRCCSRCCSRPRTSTRSPSWRWSDPGRQPGLSAWAAKFVLIIFTVGQLFCGAAGLTSASRTWYAFSRDRGMPGWSLFRRLTAKRVPLYAVLAVSVASLIITIPAYFGTKTGVPWAYFAITAICTVGLYLAYIIPVYLRLRPGTSSSRARGRSDAIQVGQHRRDRVRRAGRVLARRADDDRRRPVEHGFTWTAFNYSPLVLLIGLIVGIWWWLGAKNRYHGPVRTIDDVDFDGGPPPTARAGDRRRLGVAKEHHVRAARAPPRHAVARRTAPRRRPAPSTRW